jgi:hypothetical protein
LRDLRQRRTGGSGPPRRIGRWSLV